MNERDPNGTDPNQPKKSRAERVKENRRALIRAATELVGERGYDETSIARITERAGLAHGTFYRYFKSRQDLFDQLLPDVGNDLIEFLKARVSGARCGRILPPSSIESARQTSPRRKAEANSSRLA